MNSLRKILILAPVMIFLSVAAQAQTNGETPIELKVNGVGLGSSRAVVVTQLGKPVRLKQAPAFFSECSGSKETNLTLNYPGLLIELVGDGRGRNFNVVSIAVSSAKWSVAPQIAIGANTNSILSRFGRPLRTENESGAKLMIYFHTGDGGARFNVRSNKLVKIEWGLDRC